MKPGITEHRPAVSLRDRVAAIQLIVSDGTPVSVLPSTSAVMGFQFAGRIRGEEGLLSTAGVTGLLQSPRRYSYLGPTGSVMVRFTPLGASCLGVPATELTSRSVPLEDFLPPQLVRETSEQLCEARDDHSRVQVMEHFLSQLAWEPDRIVAEALRRLEGESPSVARIARELGLSERQLERRFQAKVGLSPRAFLTLRRFERAVELSKRVRSFTELALEAGYSDQPHFNRDFRRFSGKSPSAVLR
jgi:AraC-like DNA-binding protein